MARRDNRKRIYSTLEDVAHAIQASKTTKAFAVFWVRSNQIGDHYRVTDTDSVTMDKLLTSYADTWLGTYDCRISIPEITEDYLAVRAPQRT